MQNGDERKCIYLYERVVNFNCKGFDCAEDGIMVMQYSSFQDNRYLSYVLQFYLYLVREPYRHSGRCILI